MLEHQEFEQQLTDFFDSFSSSIQLIEELIEARRHAHEIIILACSRIDALASMSVHESTTNRYAFTKFLINYTGEKKLFTKISVGDFFGIIKGKYEWLEMTNLPRPGRLVRFGNQDEDFINFLNGIQQLPLTVESVERFLKRILKVLKQNFRVSPGQSFQKNYCVDTVQIMNCIKKEFKAQKWEELLKELEPAMKDFLRTKSVANILYDDFRCGSIHGVIPYIDEERFFNEEKPYWEPYVFDLDASQCFKIQFPAKFLLHILRNSIRTYYNYLLSKGVVPHRIFALIFSEDDFQSYLDNIYYLDEKTLPEETYLKHKLKNR